MELRKFYEEIADSWYNIRHWTLFREELEELSERWNDGKLLNIGCAHGADFLPFAEDEYEFYGTDISQKLLQNAERYSEKFDMEFNLFLSDMRKLPLQKESFDYIICVASLHHLLEEGKRLEALEEIKRVMKEGGEAFLTVWNKWQLNFILEDKIIEKEWKHSGETLKRKYYLYTYPEFERELKEAGLEILKIYPERDYDLPFKFFSENILALIRKTRT